MEILSRVPKASLARFRSTSKGWNTLIKLHAAKKSIMMLIEFRVCLARVDPHGVQDKVVKVTSPFSLKDPLSSNSLEEVDIRYVFHCDGLLLCTTEDNRLVVWNPCSAETKWIQHRDSYSKKDFYALGKSSCNEYKILRVVHHDNGFMHPCLVEYEIYDLTSSSWRSVGETRDWSIPDIWRRNGGVSLNGTTYFLGYGYRPPWSKTILLSFDFSTERFGHVSLPGHDPPSPGVFALSVTREAQKLCLLRTRGYDLYDIDAWISTKTESSGAMSWRKFLTVERTYHHQYFVFVHGMNFLADMENRVLVCRGRDMNSNSFLHILGEDNKYVQVNHHDAGSKCSLLLTYVPSLVQIQQAPIT